jgi:hypothetical protein
VVEAEHVGDADPAEARHGLGLVDLAGVAEGEVRVVAVDLRLGLVVPQAPVQGDALAYVVPTVHRRRARLEAVVLGPGLRLADPVRGQPRQA